MASVVERAWLIEPGLFEFRVCGRTYVVGRRRGGYWVEECPAKTGHGARFGHEIVPGSAPAAERALGLHLASGATGGLAFYADAITSA